MNIALEKTEEFINGERKRSYGDAFVRGNNGMCVQYVKHDIVEVDADVN